MANEPIYFVITTGAGGESTEYVSRHPLDAALHILQADQRGRAFQVFAVDDDRVREASLAELAASPPSSGFAAEMWRNARAAWLRHHLRIPADPDAPWELDWDGAAARWAAAFRTPLPDGIEEAVALPEPSASDWELLHERVGRLLPLLEHEEQWRDPDRASWLEWSARNYQQAWRQLNEAARRAPALRTTADFFLGMALDRDTRAGRIAGFLGFGHPGLEEWARIAYLSNPEQVAEADRLYAIYRDFPSLEDVEQADRLYGAYANSAPGIEEAAQLYARFTPDGDPLTEEERAWAGRWPREQERTRSRDYVPDGEEAQREYWQRSQAHWAAAEERETAQYAAFAFLAEHHEEITARAPAGANDGVVAQARRMLRAAFPDEQQARQHVGRLLSDFDALLDVPSASDRAYALAQHGQEWMALGRVEEALRAMTWNQPAPPEEPAPVPSVAPSLLRIGPKGGPHSVTADPRKALTAWTQQHRPGPDTLFPLNPVRIEESDGDGRWRERTPRSLVEQVRAAASGPREHWEMDRELAQWLLADEPEGLHPEEMGARWGRYLGEVPPRGPVLAWAIRLTSADASADLPARIQQGAAEEQAAREWAAIEWALESTPQRRAIYRPESELEEAVSLAAMDDAELEEVYPGAADDELGARPEPTPRATILASATVGDTRYTHAEFTRHGRRAILADSDDGLPGPYQLADGHATDTSVMYAQLTSPEGRALAASLGTSEAQRAALGTAGQAWNAARRAEQRAALQMVLYEMAEEVQAGQLVADAYTEQAARVWDQLFPLLDGRGPRAWDGERRWYSVRVAWDDTAMGTLTADPVEAVIQWARQDRPVPQYVILTGTARSAAEVEIAVGDMLEQALREADDDQAARLGQALGSWLDHVQRSVAEHTAGGQDPAAWHQAGWAWALRVGDALPPQALQGLDEDAAAGVAAGALQMTYALQAVRAADGAGTPDDVPSLQEHWKVLTAAAVDIAQARPYARVALDRLISLDPSAPQAGPGDGQELRQTGARLWYLARELGRRNLMDVFGRVAQPAPDSPHIDTPALAALPQRLQNEPRAGELLLKEAERAVGHQTLEALYGGYPDGIRQEKASAAQDASAALLLRAAGEATLGQTASRAHELHARPAPGQAAPPVMAPVRPHQDLDGAQRTAVHPPAPPHTPTTR